MLVGTDKTPYLRSRNPHLLSLICLFEAMKEPKHFQITRDSLLSCFICLFSCSFSQSLPLAILRSLTASLLLGLDVSVGASKHPQYYDTIDDSYATSPH